MLPVAPQLTQGGPLLLLGFLFRDLLAVESPDDPSLELLLPHRQALLGLLTGHGGYPLQEDALRLLDGVGGLQVPGPRLEHVRLLGAESVVEHEFEHLQRLGGESGVLEPDLHESLVIVDRLLILELTNTAFDQLVDASLLASPRVFLFNPGNVPISIKGFVFN